VAFVPSVSKKGLSHGWNPIQKYWKEPTPENRAALRDFLTPEATKSQYLYGVKDETKVAPEAYQLDSALLAWPGNDEIQLDLFLDHASNVALYPKFQEYFRTNGRRCSRYGAIAIRSFCRKVWLTDVYPQFTRPSTLWKSGRRGFRGCEKKGNRRGLHNGSETLPRPESPRWNLFTRSKSDATPNGGWRKISLRTLIALLRSGTVHVAEES
jgi:hypothetical protein